MYTKDEMFHEAIDKVRKSIDLYKDEEYVEMEFRLGYIEDGRFKSGIPKELFGKIKNRMDSCKLFSVTTENSTDYFYGERRMTNDVCVKKTKLCVHDFTFSGTGFDIRVSFSKETPTRRFAKEKAAKVRDKERVTYSYKNLKYDLTIVITTDNGVKDYTYEVEIEVVDTTRYTSHYIVHDCFLKLRDLIKACDEIEEGAALKPVD